MRKYFQAPWTLKDVALSFFISGATLFIIMLLSSFYDVEQFIEASPYKLYLITFGFLLQWLIMLAPVFVITKLKYKITKKTFGFRKVKLSKHLGLVFSSYFLYLGISIAITLLILYTNIKVPGYNLQEELIPKFGGDLPALITAGIIIVGIAPFLEELFFRSFPTGPPRNFLIITAKISLSLSSNP